MLNIKTRSVAGLTIIVTLILGASAFSQTAVTGTWKAEIREKDSDSLQISFETDNLQGRDNFGSTFKFERTTGLSRQQAAGSAAPVRFYIPSDAGVINMTGTFERNKGRGDFRFDPDPNFTARVMDLGFESIGTDKLFASAVLDVKLDTVTELRASGLKITDYEDVFKATIFKIDANYINEMSQAGFLKLDMEDLVKGRIFKIDAAYAREVNAMGFGEQSMEDLVKFRIFKITPEFLRDVKQEGFVDLNPEQLVQLRIFKIDSKFIQEMRAKGYSNPTVEELVQLKIRGKID